MIYSIDIFHGKIMDDFSMLIMDSTTAGKHESTLGNCSTYIRSDTEAHRNLYYGQIGLFGNSTDTGNIVANIRSFNF